MDWRKDRQIQGRKIGIWCAGAGPFSWKNLIEEGCGVVEHEDCQCALRARCVARYPMALALRAGTQSVKGPAESPSPGRDRRGAVSKGGAIQARMQDHGPLRRPCHEQKKPSRAANSTCCRNLGSKGIRKASGRNRRS